MLLVHEPSLSAKQCNRRAVTALEDVREAIFSAPKEAYTKELIAAALTHSRLGKR